LDAGVYEPTRDTFFRESGSDATNDTLVRGGDVTNRGAKFTNVAFYLTDFDRAAITAEVRAISGNAANPLTLADMAAVHLDWHIKANLGAEGENQAQNQANLNRGYAPTVFQSQGQDWSEGESTNNWAVWGGAGDPGNRRFRDANGNEILPGTNVGAVFTAPGQAARNPRMAPEAWGGTAPDNPNEDLPHRPWRLSDDLALAYLTDPDVVGLTMIELTNQGGNLEFWSREAAAANRPFLVVVPEPAAFSILALGSLLLLRRRRT
jgi:hypothetical protein